MGGRGGLGGVVYVWGGGMGVVCVCGCTLPCILCCSAIRHCYHSSLSSLCPTASRVNDSAFLRDSVDFSDLLEDAVEREEDRKKKCVLCVRMVGDFCGYKFFKTPGLKIISHTNYQAYSVYVRECVVRRVHVWVCA